MGTRASFEVLVRLSIDARFRRLGADTPFASA